MFKDIYLNNLKAIIESYDVGSSFKRTRDGDQGEFKWTPHLNIKEELNEGKQKYQSHLFLLRPISGRISQAADRKSLAV